MVSRLFGWLLGGYYGVQGDFSWTFTGHIPKIWLESLIINILKNINCWINGEMMGGVQELHLLDSNSHLPHENQDSMWMKPLGHWPKWQFSRWNAVQVLHFELILKFKNGTGDIDWSIYLELLSCSLGAKTQLLISRALSRTPEWNDKAGWEKKRRL